MAHRWTCSHCRHEVYYDGSPDGLDDSEILALTELACAECGCTGAVLTLNIQRPPPHMLPGGTPRFATRWGSLLNSPGA